MIIVGLSCSLLFSLLLRCDAVQVSERVTAWAEGSCHAATSDVLQNLNKESLPIKDESLKTSAMHEQNHTICETSIEDEDEEDDTYDEGGESDILSEDLPEGIEEPDDGWKFVMPTEDSSLVDYLNPAIFRDGENLAYIQQRLRGGHPVVVRNAFRREFAERVHAEILENLDKFTLQEDYDDDSSFWYHHHNMYDWEDYTDFLNATELLFGTKATKEFATNLTGRDCLGDTSPGLSYYQPGDHSLPHNDYYGYRAVAYIWHLTKDWKTGWGGHT